MQPHLSDVPSSQLLPHIFLKYKRIFQPYCIWSEASNAKVYYKQTLSLVNAFSPEDITSPLDQEQLHVNLQRIKDKFLAVTDWMAETIVDLEANNENVRIREFVALAENLQRKVNKNLELSRRK